MKIVLEHKRIEGIPLIEYYRDAEEHKGLVFIQHGYQSNKEYGSDYLALTLARKGFFVVAIDAWKHGERIQEPYITGTEKERLDEAFVAVKRTALDIIRLHHNYYKQFPTFDIVGVSLGGMVAWYLATRTDRVNKLIPVISTPDFRAMANHAVAGEGIDVQTYFDPEKEAFIASINPILRLDKLRYRKLHMVVGSRDQVVPMGPTVAFYETHKNDDMTLTVYDVDHNVPRNMQKDIFALLEE